MGDLNVNNLSANLIYQYLDKYDGKADDGKINAGIWNDFIDFTKVGNGDKSKIKYSILENGTMKNGRVVGSAINSLNFYLSKADDNQKAKIVEFLNNLETEKNSSKSSSQNTETAQLTKSMRVDEGNAKPPRTNTKVKTVATTSETSNPAVSAKPKSPSIPVVSNEVASVRTNNQSATDTIKGSIVDPELAFSEGTRMLNDMKNIHTTHLLDVAQDSIGLVEVTPSEYRLLTPEQRQYTQMALIGRYGNASHQWCAHAMSTISEKAGMDIGGHKASVQQFINWGKKTNTYRPISTHAITSSNWQSEREYRKENILNQVDNFSEGDFLIFKSDYVATTDNSSTVVSKTASHIVMFENYDPKTGLITVIEGNANLSASGENSERIVVKNRSQGVNGDQQINEFQEVNRRDGLIRKTYTVDDLASFGYSGYIDNSSRVS